MALPKREMVDKIIIDVPKHPVVRYMWKDKQHRILAVDLRGIRLPCDAIKKRGNGGYKKWYSPEDLQACCDAYFDSCMGPLIDKYGQVVYDQNGKMVKVQVRPYTISGLAYHLGISTVTLMRYRHGAIDTILEEMHAQTDDVLTFARVMDRAKQRVENYAEERLYDRDGQKGAQHVLDCAYGAMWVSSKEQAEIEKMMAEIKLRREEFELKKKIIDEGSEDDNITINIVRGGKEDD